MLAYIAHIPNSPLVLENISKEKFSDFKKINSAIEKIAEEICDSGCETVITISYLSYCGPRAHLINVSPKFNIEFSKFGDFSTKDETCGEIPLSYYIRKELEEEFTISSITEKNLDAPSSVAVVKLHSAGKRYKILPISHYTDSSEKLIELGRKIREMLEKTIKKIAVITIGDLSRGGSKILPSDAKKNDEELIKILKQQDVESILKYDQEKANIFSMRGFGPIAISLGITNGIKSALDILDYEQKYGVGMFVSKFTI